MDRPRNPSRLAALAAVLVVVASLAACGTGPVGRSPAATVGDREVSRAQVTDLLDAQAEYLRSLAKDPDRGAGAKQSLEAMFGSGRDSWSTTEAASALDALIVQEVVLADLARHGETITDADRSSARQSVTDQVGSEAEVKKIPKRILDFAIERAAARTALGRVAAKKVDREAKLRQLWEQSRKDRPMCVSIILGADEAALAPAKARLDAGEDFAKVAADLSTDAGTAANGGHLGCNTPDVAAQAFELDAIKTAKVGDVFGPVTVANGSGTGTESYLVQVTSTTGPTFEQARPQLEQTLSQASGSEVDEYLSTLLEKAKISVDPRFGSWDHATGRVVAPTAPAAG